MNKIKKTNYNKNKCNNNQKRINTKKSINMTIKNNQLQVKL